MSEYEELFTELPPVGCISMKADVGSPFTVPVPATKISKLNSSLEVQNRKTCTQASQYEGRVLQTVEARRIRFLIVLELTSHTFARNHLVHQKAANIYEKSETGQAKNASDDLFAADSDAQGNVVPGGDAT